MNINIANKQCPIKEYDFYKLSKQDRPKYLNTWYKNDRNKFSKGFITLKRVNKSTANFLYGREYNPVTINSYLDTTQYPHKYRNKATIWSIDDSSYGIWFEKLDVQLLMKWISEQKLLDGKAFIDYCTKIGGDKSTVDYN